MKRKIIITTPSLALNDAIGNEIIIQKKTLEEMGYIVFLYADDYESIFSSKMMKRTMFLNLIKEKETLLLLHYSVYWDFAKIMIEKSSCPIIIRFHNFTPYSFFSKSEREREGLELSSTQCEEILRSEKINCVLSTSSFNSIFLKKFLPNNKKIMELAPFHHIEAPVRRVNTNYHPIFDVKNILLQQKRSLFFVGRFQNHKGHLELLDILYKYILFYKEEIYLNLVGKFKSTIIKKIKKKASFLKIGKYIHLYDNVSQSDLEIFYKHSDVFLCHSQHEGFGLPIIEAQYHRLPVLTVKNGALEEIAGKNQLVIDENRPELAAVLLHKVLKDEKLRDFLKEAGSENFEQYKLSCLKKKFINYIEDVV